MTTFPYFAYGSNMLTERLRQRCRSAKVRTIARAPDFTVEFSKRSDDRSGKATLISAQGNGNGNAVLGTVFDISIREQEVLDRAEGRGYRRQEGFQVQCVRSGKIIMTSTYIAREHAQGLMPYDWYLALIMAGISEHGFGDEYAGLYQALPYDIDGNLARKGRLEALRAFQSAGIADYESLLIRATD